MLPSDISSSGSYYWIDILLPAHVDDLMAGSLLDALNDLALSATAIREGNKHTHDWHLRWMVDGEPDRTDVLGPEQMYRALTLHNNVIRHAKYVNCGSIIQQEGDSFTLAFHTAFDAVAFCLQVSNSLLLLVRSSAAC